MPNGKANGKQLRISNAETSTKTRLLIKECGMATSAEYIEYAAERVKQCGISEEIRFRKMFGEYMLYAADRPVLLVCDDTVFVKMLPELEPAFGGRAVQKGFPYPGAKEHFILDIDDDELVGAVVSELVRVTPVSGSRNKNKAGTKIKKRDKVLKNERKDSE